MVGIDMDMDMDLDVDGDMDMDWQLTSRALSVSALMPSNRARIQCDIN